MVRPKPFAVHHRHHTIASFPFSAKICSSRLNSLGRRLAGRPTIVGRRPTSKGLLHIAHVAHGPLQVGSGLDLIEASSLLGRDFTVFRITRVIFRTFSLSPFALHVPFAIALFTIKHRHSSFTPVVYALNVAHATTFVTNSYISDTAALRSPARLATLFGHTPQLSAHN